MTKRSRLTLACTLGLSAITAVTLTGCAGLEIEEVAAHVQMPTLAPDQSLAEACKISSAEVDRLVIAAEDNIGEGISLATASALNGEWPSWEFLSFEPGVALDEVRAAVINPEVSAAIDRVMVQLEDFSSVEPPTNALGVPGYLGSLGAELSQLSKAGSDLTQLCNPTTIHRSQQ